MFCPKCAEQNLDDAKFCRACGANVSLVPQALNGSLPTGEDGHEHRERRAAGVKCMIIAAGLVAVAVAVLLVAPPHDGWVFSFATLVAAVIMFGIAVGEFVAAAGHARHDATDAEERKTAELQPASVGGELPPARTTASMIQPASVAESTTRNLVPLESRKTQTRSRSEGGE